MYSVTSVPNRTLSKPRLVWILQSLIFHFQKWHQLLNNPLQRTFLEHFGYKSFVFVRSTGTYSIYTVFLLHTVHHTNTLWIYLAVVSRHLQLCHVYILPSMYSMRDSRMVACRLPAFIWCEETLLTSSLTSTYQNLCSACANQFGTTHCILTNVSPQVKCTLNTTSYCTWSALSNLTTETWSTL